MKVLLAASDRDLLLSVGKLLELNGYEVTTAFDGIQVISYTANKKYDVAILDEDIPRVACDRLITALDESGIPVVVLSNKRESVKRSKQTGSAYSRLSYPFLSEELFAKINEKLAKPNSQSERTSAGDEI